MCVNMSVHLRKKKNLKVGDSVMQVFIMAYYAQESASQTVHLKGIVPSKIKVIMGEYRQTCFGDQCLHCMTPAFKRTS